MQSDQIYPHGNPVDTWWNLIRDELDLCVDLLAQYPPAPDKASAAQFAPEVRAVRALIAKNPIPWQAQDVYEALMESLNHLEQSLLEQAAHGVLARSRDHDIAYHQYLIASYYLMKRGIYEPDPHSWLMDNVSA